MRNSVSEKLQVTWRILEAEPLFKGEKDLIWYPAEVNTSIRPGWFYTQKKIT